MIIFSLLNDIVITGDRRDVGQKKDFYSIYLIVDKKQMECYIYVTRA